MPFGMLPPKCMLKLSASRLRSDGIVGLGLQCAATHRATSLLDDMVSVLMRKTSGTKLSLQKRAGLISDRMIGLYLPRGSGSRGSITFGGYDEKLVHLFYL
eukprot:GHVS01103235.1.p1 GENE.GHVS01103235.1~~GHVS01103235.1.p1  ORF type:complete len:101 (-),score=0.06 GHVS01103235.1:226-528(-)